jgi:hypothetical protein
MDFKLVSKKNVGGLAALILVILLSQSRVFDFLIDSALGRAILILFILGISYTNKILGVVSVLFIVILFNQSNLGYIEGFTSTNKKDSSKKDVKNLHKQMTHTLSSVNSKNKKTSKESFVGREGFNIVDREGLMLRGKRSSEIPVLSNSRVQNDNVEPTDNSVFVSTHASF